MVTAQKFDLGNGGYTIAYRCFNCFKTFEISLLSVSDIGTPYKIMTQIDEIFFCPFCGKEV